MFSLPIDHWFGWWLPDTECQNLLKQFLDQFDYWEMVGFGWMWLCIGDNIVMT